MLISIFQITTTTTTTESTATRATTSYRKQLRTEKQNTVV